MEFKEITKRDAEVHLAQALDKLRRTGAGMGCLVGEQADIVDRDFDGFKRLLVFMILTFSTFQFWIIF